MNTFLVCFFLTASKQMATAAIIETAAIEIFTFRLKILAFVSSAIFCFSFSVSPKTLSELQLLPEQHFFARSGLSL